MGIATDKLLEEAFEPPASFDGALFGNRVRRVVECRDLIEYS